MLPTTALSRILVAHRFAWPNQLVGFLFQYKIIIDSPDFISRKNWHLPQRNSGRVRWHYPPPPLPTSRGVGGGAAGGFQPSLSYTSHVSVSQTSISNVCILLSFFEGITRGKSRQISLNWSKLQLLVNTQHLPYLMLSAAILVKDCYQHWSTAFFKPFELCEQL